MEAFNIVLKRLLRAPRPKGEFCGDVCLSRKRLVVVVRRYRQRGPRHAVKPHRVHVLLRHLLFAVPLLQVCNLKGVLRLCVSILAQAAWYLDSQPPLPPSLSHGGMPLAAACHPHSGRKGLRSDAVRCVLFFLLPILASAVGYSRCNARTLSRSRAHSLARAHIRGSSSQPRMRVGAYRPPVYPPRVPAL